MRVRDDVADAWSALSEVVVAIVDEELLSGGDIAASYESNASSAAVGDELDVQVGLAMVVDEAGYLWLG